MKDNEFFNWLWPKVKSALSGKVDKEKGKGLSSNDYTTEEKIKLANTVSCTRENVMAVLGSVNETERTISASEIDTLFK